LRLLKNFVNSKSPVSTGFLRFFSVLLGFLADFEPFASRHVRKTLIQSGCGVPEYCASVGAPRRLSKGQREVYFAA
jgi:hypothetical protein